MISDLITTNQFHRLGLYNEFFRKLEVDRQILLGLSINSHLTFVLSLNRNKKDLAESNRRSLSGIKPHLLAAYHRADTLRQFQFALGASGGAAILLSSNGRVRHETSRLKPTWQPRDF